ncbi:MAG: hypothetical protein LBC42_02805, partial [Puniceicoccales bacterium]|nr:hypothetical protein [Puniceicoccales bacterium]
GGAIYSAVFTGDIACSLFCKNKASKHGGAIYIKNLFIGCISNSLFIDNLSRINGGALCLSSDWLCTAENVNKHAEDPCTIGDTLFLHNKSGGHGGAICCYNSADVYAAHGDVIFQGNMHGVEFDENWDSSGGTSNAMHFGNRNGGNIITLTAFDDHAIRFYDPISTEYSPNGLSIRINDCGVWPNRQTGMVLFDKCQSVLYFSNVSVNGGIVALHNGAKFGACYDDGEALSLTNGTFTLHENATLRIAYEQERRKYVLDDGIFDRSDPSKIEIELPAYCGIVQTAIPPIYSGVSEVYAKQLDLNGRLHFVIPSNIGDGAVLLHTPGLVNLDEKTTYVTLEMSSSDSPIEIGQSVVLLHSSFGEGFPVPSDGRSTAITGSCSNANTEAYIATPITFGVASIGGYLFDINISDSGKDIIATLKSEIKPRTIVSPAMQAITNCRSAGLLLINHSVEVASSLMREKRSALDTNLRRESAWAPFFVPFSIDHSIYETGINSSLRTHALTFAGGVMGEARLKDGFLRFGEFFDYGVDRYRSTNNFAESEFGPAGSISGKGMSHSYAVATILRVDFDGNDWGYGYCEGACKIGGLSSKWESGDLVDAGRSADHKTSSLVCGGYLAFGYVLNDGAPTAVDIGGKCFWAHHSGGHVTFVGKNVLFFNAADSLRLRLGISTSKARNENFSLRLAAAFEWELDGESRAMAHGYPLPVSSFKGNTAIGEMQLSWKPSDQSGLTIDLGGRGYFGVREGFSAHIQLSVDI